MTQDQLPLDATGLTDTKMPFVGPSGVCGGCKRIKSLVFQSFVTGRFYCCECCQVKAEIRK